MAKRHVISLFDLTSEEIRQVFKISAELKSEFLRGVRRPSLNGHVLGLLFEKPSLRTRVSFEAAITHLGGNSMFLGADVGWGSREPVPDFARVISQYVDVVVCRAKTHERVEELAENATCSVINGLTDVAHPCQALTDLFTLQEIAGSLDTARLAYVGDANNVACSLAVASAKLGVPFSIAHPNGYGFQHAFLDRVMEAAPGFELLQTEDPIEAVVDATAVYTDVWASMGQEDERVRRGEAFADYQVNDRIMASAKSDASFLHCLPARRGEEVTPEVIDGPQSAVIQQAENRMHVQKGLLQWLLG
ncbi:MAG: ornithine carbamoyltransferase [Planctomycetaceae bacterium]|nr:ornithine carbamoyltransferase [Planctomycetaceae bacterium]